MKSPHKVFFESIMYLQNVENVHSASVERIRDAINMYVYEPSCVESYSV